MDGRQDDNKHVISTVWRWTTVAFVCVTFFCGGLRTSSFPCSNDNLSFGGSIRLLSVCVRMRFEGNDELGQGMMCCLPVAALNHGGVLWVGFTPRETQSRDGALKQVDVDASGAFCVTQW